MMSKLHAVDARFGGVYAIYTQRGPEGKAPHPLTEAEYKHPSFKYISPYANLDVECCQAVYSLSLDKDLGTVQANSHGDLFYVANDYFGPSQTLMGQVKSPAQYLDTYLAAQTPHGTLVWKERAKVSLEMSSCLEH